MSTPLLTGRIWPVVLLCILTACGSHRPSLGPVAAVGSDRISQAELDQYTRYVVAFDALAYPDSAEAACARAPSGPACGRVRTQALVRLIQERLVQRYAGAHAITLTSDDRARIDGEMSQLAAVSAPTWQLFTRHAVSQRFMRSVLSRQILVQKVQAQIAGHRAQVGFQVHIRKYTVPIGAGADRQAIYRQAVALATGGAAPAGTRLRVEWVAPFRLPSDVRAAVSAAHRGEYVGPFKRKGSYELVQVLQSGTHRYGAPARRAVKSRLFHQWLHETATATPVRCRNAGGQLAPCPGYIMKSV